MDGIGGNICILATKADINDNKVVDVLEVVPDHFLVMLRGAILNDQVSGGTDGYLVSDMARQDELTIVPANVNLAAVSKELIHRIYSWYPHPLSTDVEVMTLYVAEELMSCSLFQERDACSTIMCTKINIQQHSTSDNGHNIGVSGSFR